MPELPEVETVRRDLESRVIGRTIVSCEVSENAPRLVQLVTRDEFCRSSPGAASRACGGAASTSSSTSTTNARGCCTVACPATSSIATPMRPKTRGCMRPSLLDDGHELRWADVRKFGKMWIVEDATMVVETLGPEPLEAEFTPEVLRARAGKRTAPIKSVLLDQKVVAGVGNLYSDEALHYAKIHPLRPANKLKPDDWRRLHAGILEALHMGINARGSSLGTTLRDHVNVDGDPGENQKTVKAYGRDGEPCYTCGTLMRRIIVGGRSAVFCPKCQPAPRGTKKSPAKRRKTKGKLYAKSAVKP